MRKVLYRAANDDIITDCAAFAETPEAAKVYLDNPGYGGAHLYRADVDIAEAELLDLVDCDNPVGEIGRVTGLGDPGAIGVDEWVPRISYDLREAGFNWVRVNESYPAGTVTWIYVGSGDIDMEPIEVFESALELVDLLLE